MRYTFTYSYPFRAALRFPVKLEAFTVLHKMRDLVSSSVPNDDMNQIRAGAALFTH
jgi:hypothetical protein